MRISIAASAASHEVPAVSGQFVADRATFVVLFVVFAAFAAFALTLMSRKARQDSTNAPSPSPQASAHRWTIAGVTLTAIAVMIAAVQLLHGE